MARLLTLAIGLLLGVAGANEQHFPDRSWSQLRIPGFDIVYPAGYDDEAHRVADRLSTYWPALLETLPLERPPRRIPILLSTPTLIANGAAGGDPLHSIFYNRPSPLTGLEWFDTLSVHEGRHLVQFHQPLDTVTGRVAGLLAGENGVGLVLVLFYPTWLLEGDAVLEETRLTEGGRGRVASFELWLRTHELTRPRYSYDRAMLGTGFESYPTVSPYDLGYFMTSYLRRHHGDRILDQALADTAVPGQGFTLDGRIRHLTGQGLAETYQSTWDELRQRWRAQVEALDITAVETLWRPEGDHWRSLYPIATDRDRVLAVETDLRDGSFLVALENGAPRRLTRLPRQVAAEFYGGAKQRGVSYAAGRFCWTEPEAHPRFALEVGRDIHCYSEADDRAARLTRGGDYTSAALATDGRSLAAHHFNEARHSELRWLDDEGRVLARQTLPRRSLAFDLAPTGDDGWVFALLTDTGTRFMRWRPDGPGLTALTGPVRGETLRSPRLGRHWLFYTSDRSGIDSVWALSRHTGERYQVTQRPFGSYFVNRDPANRRLVFSDYGANGHAVVGLDWAGGIEPGADWVPAAASPGRPTAYSAPLADRAEPVRADPEPPGDYHRLAHAWDPNSWLVQADNDSVLAQVHSNNLLNTLTIDLSGGYHGTANAGIGGVQLDWRRGWPVIGLGLERRVAEDEDRLDTEASLSLGLPLSRTDGLWRWAVAPAASASVTDRKNPDNDVRETVALLSTGITLQSLHEPAPRDLQAPWGLTTAWQLDTQPDDGAWQVHNRTVAQAPGLVSNHHLTLSGQWQQRAAGFTGASRYQSPPMLDSPGLSGPVRAARANYRFSLGPVDAALGRLWYLRSATLAFDAHWQDAGAGSASALGLQLSLPSNVLRNSRLRLEPSVSVYLRPRTDDIVSLFGLTLTGN